MKQLFIGLVALNLCYLLFQQLSTDDAVVPEELPVGALPTVTIASSSPASVASMLPEPVPDSVAQVEIKTDPVANNSSKTSAPADSSTDTSTLARQAKGEQQRPATAGVDRPAAAAAPDQQGSCVIAGPFRTRREGQALVAQLANAGIDATLQPRDTALLPDYMVYVGPETSQADARALEAKFTARKMDSHVIGAGALQNALSLGVFSRGPLAKSLRLQLEKEGYNARISELTVNRRGFQVRTRLPQIIRAKLVEADTPMIDCSQAIAQR